MSANVIIRDPDPRLVALAEELADDNPEKVVLTDAGAVWVRDGATEYGIYSRVICSDRILLVLEHGRTVLHRPATVEVAP